MTFENLIRAGRTEEAIDRLERLAAALATLGITPERNSRSAREAVELVMARRARLLNYKGTKR